MVATHAMLMITDAANEIMVLRDMIDPFLSLIRLNSLVIALFPLWSYFAAGADIERRMKMSRRFLGSPGDASVTDG
jgi:hypothetical protein